MVTKRIRSEYMKKFKDPKWETYTRCYEEMLKYRLTRRLLEHTHNPWFWTGSESDSDSGGRTPPPPPSKNQVQTETSRDQPAAEAELEECEGARNTEPVPQMALQEGEETADLGSQLESARVGDEERASSQGNKQKKLIHAGENRVRDTAGRQQNKSSRPSKQTWGTERVRPAPARQAEEDCKEPRHPFALYGSGEKAADMAGRKTHNVGPAASTNEIHDSALRAKTRREVERQIQTQKIERRRAKSVDVNKARKLVQPEYNPWLTEYMRCFSARSR
ncbi:centriole, cilia and spindle-associated protein [Notolabrus celidotus]|uniref:centriole, cilia and spindle-associated protein n=1 Tax=Notolabrus celidotus TaxID=1203425 RepID=UPI0014901555|nr:centriole, cilia and spindle-associated protein [Notolabrus celidotus]